MTNKAKLGEVVLLVLALIGTLVLGWFCDG